MAVFRVISYSTENKQMVYVTVIKNETVIKELNMKDAKKLCLPAWKPVEPPPRVLESFSPGLRRASPWASDGAGAAHEREESTKGA